MQRWFYHLCALNYPTVVGTLLVAGIVLMVIGLAIGLSTTENTGFWSLPFLGGGFAVFAVPFTLKPWNF